LADAERKAAAGQALLAGERDERSKIEAQLVQVLALLEKLQAAPQ
jgi:hypothetical protein